MFPGRNGITAKMDPCSPPNHSSQLLQSSNQPASTATEHLLQQNNAGDGNAMEELRRGFCTFNLNDLRSPAMDFNRTPIVLEEHKSLNMNGNYANVTMDNQVANETNSCISVEEDTSSACCMPLTQTPVMQQQMDTRSPTFGLNGALRIVGCFNHALNKTNKTATLEKMLSGVSLDDNSTDSNIPKASSQLQTVEIVENNLAKIYGSKPRNKLLERVRNSADFRDTIRNNSFKPRPTLLHANKELAPTQPKSKLIN